MTAKLIGGPQLRARLASLVDVPEDFARQWAHDTADELRKTAPNARRPASRTFTTKALRLKAAVYGAFWWVFVDRGTKAHDIFGAGKRNPPDILRFEVGGRTIFASKAHHKRTRRNPFITRAAQGAFKGWELAVVKQWNRRRTGGHGAFL
jgi:hypothetical protein